MPKKWSDPKDPDHHRARKGEHSFALREEDGETMAGKARVWDIEDVIFGDAKTSLVLGVWKDGELTAYIEGLDPPEDSDENE